MPPRVLLSWLVPNLSSFQISPVAVTFHFPNSRANTNNFLKIWSDSLLLFTLLRIPLLCGASQAGVVGSAGGRSR